MQEIIAVQAVTINESEINAVDARELWVFLGIDTRFDVWINRRISEYGFISGIDFYPVLSKTPNGGRPAKNFTISLDMAKELSMVERNEKGKQARKYFIDCERLLKESAPNIPKTYAEALQLAANQAALIEIQEKELEQAQPKIEFVDKYVDSSGRFNLTQAAKNLNFKRKDLIECLIRDGRIFRRGKKGKIEPYVQEVNRGIFEIKTGSTDLNHAFSQMYITAKGMNWLAETYSSELGE